MTNNSLEPVFDSVVKDRRIIIPPELRKIFPSKDIILADCNRNGLKLFRLDVLERVANQLPVFNPLIFPDELNRLIFPNCYKESFDRQGRILLPKRTPIVEDTGFVDGTKLTLAGHETHVDISSTDNDNVNVGGKPNKPNIFSYIFQLIINEDVDKLTKISYALEESAIERIMENRNKKS